MGDSVPDYSSGGAAEHRRLALQARCFADRERDAVLGLLALPAPARLLSIGCGTGVFEFLLQAGHGRLTVVGVDLEPAAVALAALLGLEVVCADALASEDLLPPGPFDGALIRLVLQHIEPIGDRAVLVGRTVAKVREGGRVVLIDADLSSLHLTTGDPALDGDLARLALPFHPTMASANLARLLRGAGCDDAGGTVLPLTTWDVGPPMWRALLAPLATPRPGASPEEAEAAARRGVLLDAWATHPDAHATWNMHVAAGVRRG